ncbi:MAG: aldehyde dehydrogenase [Sediminibacterium sp. Gen4]|jgi:aldehyde dehydrogenase (NAD+)|uniref:aldehyde dehydrogenase n=1 Tax=unclassified Sediminibacterium TaxID=2635961 RepID=UPI0015BB17C5|nr:MULTISPECIES: aldehyde dehydrogenase [unclassified Sediminibacterium]MBW0162487.1 aldehyde dehydrogenase [Sediminibacterium sp.]MBW0164336.1 aldehyde dehydrogenase [Sediminibacterium sp.]NWK65209.1 aldehyde dehydrogenase [Sediminibacterium sp. Gen4]
MSTVSIEQLNALRHHFASGATRPYAFRKQQLLALKKAIIAHEEEIYAALYADLKKSPEECWVTENGFVLSELDHAISWLSAWMEPESKSTNLLNLPSKSKVMKEPLGVVLIIGPWNYPFQLLLTPLIGAIAAGNCVVLKPSEFAPATDAVMQKIIESIFPKEYILYAPGDGATVIPAMMHHFSFDHVFYTGSTAVGKIIYKMAAERLVPVTLELGGKSPCVVTENAHIKVAANRIVVTKFSNAGQMCIAPDYVLVHASVKEQLIDAMKKKIVQFFSDQPKNSHEFGKIINEKQFNRLIGYLQDGKVVHGGDHDIQQLFIAPTLMESVSLDSSIMTDEIFGPILPVITYQTEEEALSIIQRNPNPLAFYVFSNQQKEAERWLDKVPSGAACINNASWHATNHHLPFGGRGFSGTGRYHGKYSFDTFSHEKAVLQTPTWFDPSMKYPPFKGKLKLFKKFI